MNNGLRIAGCFVSPALFFPLPSKRSPTEANPHLRNPTIHY